MDDRGDAEEVERLVLEVHRLTVLLQTEQARAEHWYHTWLGVTVLARRIRDANGDRAQLLSLAAGLNFTTQSQALAQYAIEASQEERAAFDALPRAITLRDDDDAA